ncbi:MFS transporter [Nocardioides hwasunensis]|uniref:MFS transporter n=1 Tax=Nocardioides hwasunensis TaxID=397258 RepID=A0ABR8MPE5_9ACTN|nr:MFS transporter [Nocardioides hwasunensis]MBD3916926.1 MFS transporter [Nocardioides hwasunensis]
MTATGTATEVGTTRRWAMLGASTTAQAAAAVMTNGAVFLIPALHEQRGMSIAEAGLVTAAPMVGVMLTLVAWGWFTDRRGERLALMLGLGAATLAGLLAVAAAEGVVLGLALFLGGAAAASTNAASGRVVVGWFPPHRRGLAMGVRQMAQPVGVGIAAIAIPVLADTEGIRAALWAPTIACALATVVVALVVIDPPRTAPRSGPAPNPYRQDRYLARIHGVSVLLVVPQFVVWTFSLVWLIQARGWSPAAAGALVAGTQLLAALGRIAAGQLSDHVMSRMRPLRWVAIAAGLAMAALGLAAGLDLAVAVPLIVIATVITVADNGLAFTAVAERSGPFWSGRALGVQNTAQFLAAAMVPPLGGWLVGSVGYPVTFVVAALFPLVAVALVPVRDERPLE